MFFILLRIIKKSLIYAGIFFSLFCIGLCLYIIYVEKFQYPNLIFKNVYINDINFSGKTKSDVEKYFKKQNKKLQQISVIFVYKDIETASFSGKLLKLSYNPADIAYNAYKIGRSKNFASKIKEILLVTLLDEKINIYAPYSFDLKPIRNFLAKLKEKYSIPPENARFEIQNGKVTAFKIEKNGIAIDTLKAEKEISSILKDIAFYTKNEIIIHIHDYVVHPSITIKDINNFGIQEKIGEGISDYKGSSTEREHNIILATKQFHGILIPPNSILSFNQIVGDVSEKNGYKRAYIIKDGKTILGDGGGICQTSTTLFRAALNTGLDIVERTNHSYRVRYYENDSKPGFDATVFFPKPDLKIRNNTPSYLLIQSYVDKNAKKVIFEFYGTPDNRKIYISPVQISNEVPPPEALYEEDPSLPKGTTKQIDFPAWGAKTTFHYKVEKDGQTIEEKTFSSVYKPWRAVFLVGTKE